MEKITLPQFIDSVGAAKVARLLNISVQTVCFWREFHSCPRPETAKKLIEISLGMLSWQSIYEPYVKTITAGNKE